MSSFAFIRDNITNKVTKKKLGFASQPKISNNDYSLNSSGNYNLSVLSLNGVDVTSSGDQLNYVHSVTDGIASANKALITNSSNNINNINNISCNQLIVNNDIIILNPDIASQESNSVYLQKIKPGKAQSSKALVLDSSKNIDTVNKLSVNALNVSNNKIINNCTQTINKKKILPITLNSINNTFANNLVAICWSSELLLAVAISNNGTNNDIITSTDGINWTQRTTPVNSAWSCINWNPDLALFTVLANNGSNRVMNSTDGINWTSPNNSNYNTQSWSSLCWSPQLSLYAAVATSGTERIMTSSDGQNWSLVNNSTNTWTSICWSPELNMFVGIGNANSATLRSTNGINWTTSSTTQYINSWSSICWVPRLKLFLAVSNASIYSSVITNDGNANINLNWNIQTTPYNSNWQYITDVPQLNITVAVADSGYDRLMYTYNGTQWFTIQSRPNYPLNCIVYAKELNKLLITSGNTNSYSDIVYDTNSTNLMTNTDWYTLFNRNKLYQLNSYAIGQSGTNPNVELQLQSNANAPSYTSLWYNQRIQDASSLYITFKIKFSGTGEGTSFNIGYTNYAFAGNSFNKSAFSLVFILTSSFRPAGIYLFDNNGYQINYYSVTLNTNAWFTVEILYNNSSTNTWQVKLNSTSIISYNNNNHLDWINSSGSYFGFGSTNTSSSTHNASISNFALSGNFITSQTTTVVNSKIFNSNIFTNTLELTNYGKISNALINDTNSYTSVMTGSISNVYEQTNFIPSQVIWISELSIFIMGNITNNTIAYSIDGYTWRTRTTITGFTISSLCWSPQLKLIVAVTSAGSNNRVITSPDGINWTLQTNVPATPIIPWKSVCWSPELNLFVAVGNGANSLTQRVMTSSDGINWSIQTAGASNCQWNAVCWSSELNMFVAIASNSSFLSMYSYDGIKWYPNNIIYGSVGSGYNNFSSICWSPDLNMFVAMASGTFLISYDGINWIYSNRNITNNNSSYQIIYWHSDLKIFIGINNLNSSNFIYSFDGIIWNYKNVNGLYAPVFYSIAYSPELEILLVIGNNHFYILSNLKYGYNSIKGNNNLTYFNESNLINNVNIYNSWTAISSNINNQWTSICYSSDLNLFVAVSNTGTNNRVMISSDNGYTWTTSVTPVDNDWTSVCYSSELNLFVAVSSSGTNNRVMTSSDGIVWTSRTSATDNDWTSICYSSELSLFVAVSSSGTNNRVMTSSDGIVWTSRTSATDNDWTSVCYSPEFKLFISVSNTGTNNRIMTSTNGIIWTSRTSAADNNWTSVCYSSKLKLCVAISNSGSNNRIMISNDGINWSLNNIIYKSIKSNKNLSMNSIFAGYTYSFFIYGDGGSVRGCGSDNAFISSGLGTFPVIQTQITNVKKIVGSQYASKYLLNNGQVQIRGDNRNAEIGHVIQPSYTSYPFQAGYSNPYTIPNINNAIDIASGTTQTFILLSDGTIKSCGVNNAGQLGNGNMINQYQYVSVLGINNAIAISSYLAANHALALLSDGTIKSWGYNNKGQLGNNTTTSSSTPVNVSNITTAIAIAVGSEHSLALLADGTIKSWGSNTGGQLGNGNFLDNLVPTTVLNINNAIAISAASDYSMALLSDGTVKMWGTNGYGQLGIGTAGSNYNTPMLVPSLTNVIAISAGYQHVIVLLSNGTAKGWGRNNQGMLGNYSNTDSPSPVTVVNSSAANDILTNIKIDSTSNTDYANNNWKSICWSDEMKVFIAVANSGNNNRIMASNDGYNWYSKNNPDNNNFTSICWADLISKFIIISSDGTNNITYSAVGNPNILSNVTTLGNKQISNNTSNSIYINGSYGAERLNITEDSNNNLLRLSYNNSTTNSVDFKSSLSPNYQINIINNSSNKITNIVNHNSSTYGLSLNSSIIPANATDLNKLAVTTFGQAQANKALVLDSSLNISNINNISTNKLLINGSIIFDSADNSSALVTNAIPGTVQSNTIAVVDADKNIELFNKIQSNEILVNNSNSLFSNSLQTTYNYIADMHVTKSQFPTIYSYTGIIWVNDFNLFIATGSLIIGDVYNINISSDGINWYGVKSWTVTGSLNFAYSPTLKMVVGFSNYILYYSYNGYEWSTIQYTSYPIAFTSICWASNVNLFVAVNNTTTNRVMTSSDGITWTFRTTPNTNNYTSIVYHSTDNLLVAVANSGTGNRVMTSSDGINWTSRTSASNNNWTSICYSSQLNLLVAVANSGTGNRVMTSSDGINWTSRSSASDLNWTSVVWASNLSLFVAVANTGTQIMKSSNGINWTLGMASFNLYGTAICYSPELNLLVGVSDNNSTYQVNRAFISSDATNWSLIDTNYDLKWYEMIYINELSLFVACSNGSSLFRAKHIAISSNGIDWTLKYMDSSINNPRFRGLAWSPTLNLLVVSATSGSFYRTSDCITWTATTVPSGTWIYIKWFSNLNMFIACSSGGANKMIKSTDGINWTVVTLPSANNIYTIDYSPSLNMLFAASNGNPAAVYFTSIDNGTTWTSRTLTVNGTSIIFNGEVSITWISQLSKFLLYDVSVPYNYYLSTDGINWTFYSFPSSTDNKIGIRQSLSANITGKPIWISKFNKLYVINYTGYSETALLESSDAITWTSATRLANKTPLYNLCWASSIETLVAYGFDVNNPACPFLYLNQYIDRYNNYNIDSINKLNKLSNNQINNSINTWISRSSASDNNWTSICYSSDKNLFVAVSNSGTNNRVMTSSDGIVWTSRTSVDNNWTSVCYSSFLSLFVAVSNSGTGNRVMTSLDGITWTSRTSASDNNWTSICSAEDVELLVAVSSTGTGNRVMTSIDGINWISGASVADNDWTSICYSSNLLLFVAVSSTGIDNRVMTSIDGLTWTSRTTGSDNNWTSVCYSPTLELFAAVSNTGDNRIMISSDGIEWSNVNSYVNNNWTSICWANSLELFIAIANSGTNDCIMTSIDGYQWIIQDNNINNSWTSICWSNNHNCAVAVSNTGTANRVLTSTIATQYLQNNYACANTTLYVNQNNGNVGLGTLTPNYQLELSADSAGKPSTAYWTVSSDARLKENIEDADLDICYNNMKNLRLVQYTWKDNIYQSDSIENQTQLGWIADEVETILPKSIRTVKAFDLDDCKTLDSDQIIATMYGTAKKLINNYETQNNEINELTNEIEVLQNFINELNL
jgi:alpha-tubulin suppressor-like RCC1 family protein